MAGFDYGVRMQPETVRQASFGHWCRKVMEEDVADLVLENVGRQADVLEISGDAWSAFGFSNYRSVDYPQFDICQDRLSQQFDLIIAEQVFEHIRYPQRAANNVLRMLRPGGFFLITTPFLIRYHPAPEDLWRWSKEGLHYFLEDAGFQEVDTAAWGNAECVTANLSEWVLFDRELHSLDNDENFPISVWGLGRKSGRRETIRRRIRSTVGR